MHLSENRALAGVVLGLCILLSISLSGGSAMRNMRNETQQVFYEGVLQGGERTGLSIARDLSVRADKAAVIASIAKQYLSSADTRIVAVEDAAKRLTNAEQLRDSYRANMDLTRVVEDLYSVLENQSLSKSDSDAVYAAHKEMESRADTISRDAYNTAAHEFNASIARFPANIISGFVNVAQLQTFD